MTLHECACFRNKYHQPDPPTLPSISFINKQEQNTVVVERCTSTFVISLDAIRTQAEQTCWTHPKLIKSSRAAPEQPEQPQSFHLTYTPDSLWLTMKSLSQMLILTFNTSMHHYFPAAPACLFHRTKCCTNVYIFREIMFRIYQLWDIYTDPYWRHRGIILKMSSCVIPQYLTMCETCLSSTYQIVLFCKSKFFTYDFF